MQPLTIYIAQYDIAWRNVEANLQYLDKEIQDIEPGSLLVLPETFATGFCIEDTAMAQAMEGEIVQWMLRHSKHMAICGSVLIKEEENYYNRFIWAQDGKVKYTYNKRHLFSLGSENKLFTAGNSKPLINYKGFTISPFICYDLRFPVWCRNTHPLADIYIFVANWPAPRHQAWQQLLQARAIENQVYVIACNRIGTDGNGVNHSGGSGIINYLGELKNQELNIGMQKYEIDAEELSEYRIKFPFLSDSDPFLFQ